jgi:histone H1/5
MSAIRVGKWTIQLAATAAMIVAFASVARAQKVKPTGPPVTTHGATKANDAAAKGQATAEASRTDADADKAAKAADKKEDAAERAAMKAARNEPTKLLKGIKLTKAQETSVDAIEKKYDGQLDALEKQEDAAEKAGTSTASFDAKIAALRTQERTDLRAVLNSSQTSQFDKNASSSDAKP